MLDSWTDQTNGSPKCLSGKDRPNETDIDATDRLYPQGTLEFGLGLKVRVLLVDHTNCLWQASFLAGSG